MSGKLEARKSPRCSAIAPKSVLKPGIIYSGDNGQRICLHCAGMSAKFTGRDLSGHKVTALGADDAQYWFEMLGKQLACEGGCTVYPSIKTADAKEVQPQLQLA